MSRQILAIDIRKDHIAAVLLGTGLKTSTITACAKVPREQMNGAEDGDHLKHNLVRLMEEIDATNANIVVSLPPDGVIFRSVAVPFKEDAKIRQVLPFELEPVLPLEIDNLTIDFQKRTIDDKTEVLAVAIDNELLESKMGSMTAAGLRPHLVVPGGIPLAKLISVHDPHLPENALILDVDTHATTLIALVGGQIELIRSIPFGVNDEPAVEALALRVRQTMTAQAESHGRNVTPGTVYISGPSLQQPENARRLTEALELPVEEFDIRRLLPKVEIENTVGWSPHLMNHALALAYLEAEGTACPNFHRISSPLRNYWAAYRPFIMGPALLAALVLFLGLGGAIFDSIFLKKKVDALHAQMVQVFKSTFPDTRLSAAPLDQMKSKLKEASKSQAGPVSGGTSVRSIDILLQVSQLIPTSVNVVFNQLVVGSNAVTISGETADFNTVDDIKGRLEQSDMFKQVTIASANMSKSGDNVRFKLKIDL